MQTLAPSAACPERSPYQDLGGFEPAPKGTPSMYDELTRMAQTDYSTNPGVTVNHSNVTSPTDVRVILANRDELSVGQVMLAHHQGRVAVTEQTDQAYREQAQQALRDFHDVA